jgi:adenylate cyclase
MGREIERKFLLKNDSWRRESEGHERLRQGYLVAEKSRSVRVRLAGAENAVLTVKGETRGATRPEFDVAIRRDDAEKILEELCLRPLIDKTRHHLEHEGHAWVIDEFHGAHAGLVVAEIELATESESFERPDWLGEEITDDPRYYNANLVRNGTRPEASR